MLPPACAQFDGSNCYLRLDEGAVAGVLMVAADNARAARSTAAQVEQQVLAQRLLQPGLALQLLTAALQAEVATEPSEKLGRTHTVS